VIFVRADAVMLSGETAVGRFPVESVETMVRIIEAAETVASPARPALAHDRFDDVQMAVSLAVCDLAEELDANAIVPLTQSGATALAVARNRPEVPIVAATTSAATARMLALVWGVSAVIVPFPDDFAELLEGALGAVCAAGYATTGDLVALTAGLATRTPGRTDFIHVRTVP
jgi:pyruvate kinase